MVALLVIAAMSAFFGDFEYSSVCARCGLKRYTSNWQIPGTRITICRFSSVEATPVSKVLRRNGIVGKHEHDWRFIRGSGSGIRRVVGTGQEIKFAVESEGVAAVLDASYRFGERQFHDRLLAVMFDPRTSRVVEGLGESQATNALGGAPEFHTWLANEMPWFEEDVATCQKREW
jgi:hypothetical protein